MCKGLNDLAEAAEPASEPRALAAHVLDVARSVAAAQARTIEAKSGPGACHRYRVDPATCGVMSKLSVWPFG